MYREKTFLWQKKPESFSGSSLKSGEIRIQIAKKESILVCLMFLDVGRNHFLHYRLEAVRPDPQYDLLSTFDFDGRRDA